MAQKRQVMQGDGVLDLPGRREKHRSTRGVDQIHVESPELAVRQQRSPNQLAVKGLEETARLLITEVLDFPGEFKQLRRLVEPAQAAQQAADVPGHSGLGGVEPGGFDRHAHRVGCHSLDVRA